MDAINNSEEQTRTNDLKTTSFWLLMAFAAGALTVLAHYCTEAIVSHYPYILWSGQGGMWVALLWGGGWWAAAFVIGFLFGIPKVLQTPAQNKTDGNPPKPDDTLHPPLRVNTNLEEISDWLTKILVGATLTQVVKIPGAVGAAARFMSVGSSEPGAQTLAAGVVLYFSALGFFSGYVLTRMFFSLAFARADKGPFFFPDASGLEKQSIALGSPTALGPEIQSVLSKLNNIPITDQLTAPQAVAVAKAANLSGSMERALQAARLAVSKNPSDANAHLNLAAALNKCGASDSDTLAELEKARALADSGLGSQVLEDIYNSLVYLCLYLNPPVGFSKAIEFANECIRKSLQTSSLWVNLSCAYAQQYKYLREHEGTDDQIQEARKSALNSIEKTLQGDPTTLTRLQQLYNGTSPDPQDNDLQVFKGEPDFDRLLNAV